MNHCRFSATAVRVLLLGALAAVGASASVGASACSRLPRSSTSASAPNASSPMPATPTTGIRLSGTVEAVRFSTVMVPRLAGTIVNTLTITRLAAAGQPVKVGDVLVEFDRQEQARNALDREAEVVDLDGQIEKKRSDQAIARAKDNTELAQAEHDGERARFATLNNDLIARVEAEKNTLTLEQATAKFAQLRETFTLKRKAEEADLKMLQIRRERSQAARLHAEGNAALMAVRATFAGIVVVKSTFKGSGMAEVQEGDQVRPGLPVLDIVDPTVMRVRARVNQADIGLVAAGQSAKIRLDAYPELVFDGRVDLVAPLATTSGLTPQVRSFAAIVSIRGSDPLLMPDLTASVDVMGVAPAAALPPVAVSRPAGGH